MLKTADRREVSKAAVDTDAHKRRCRRENQMAEIRSCKRDAHLQKKKRLKTFQSDIYPSWEQLEGISSLVDGVLPHDNNLQLNATTQFCELLEIGRNPPINGVILYRVVPRFVEFLMTEDFPQLQCEASWALACIASTTSEGAKVVIDSWALPIFVKLLGSPNAEVREQAVFALGILAGHSPTCRDSVLGHGALVPLLEQLKENLKLSMLRNATWTLAIFCGGKPRPSFEQVRPALETLKRLLHNDDWEVLSDSCLALSYLANGTSDEIEELIKAGVSPRLVELLGHSSSSVVISALLAISNIASEEDNQAQVILNDGALGHLPSLLTGSKNDSIKRDACFFISNITAGNTRHIQAVIDAHLIEPLVKLLQADEFGIRACAALAISNALSGGSFEQMGYLVSKGCIEALCDLVRSPDPCIVYTGLKGLCEILEMAGTSPLSELVGDALGHEILLELMRHKNKIIAAKAHIVLSRT